jgi:hypothetical protein
MSRLPRIVFERLGWRTHLPPVQIYCSVAKWCAQMIAARNFGLTDFKAIPRCYSNVTGALLGLYPEG